MRRPRTFLRATAVLALLLTTAAGGAAARTPQLLRLDAVRVGDDLGCLLRTSGLPDERMVSSMESGLVSSIELNLEILDGSGRTVMRRRLTLRLSFDLWDEVFTVRVQERPRVFDGEAALRDWLEAPSALALIPIEMLDGRRAPFVLRAMLATHPIAPRDRHRVEDAIAGDDRNEATVSVGSLIRFFYADSDAQTDPAGSVRSRPFSLEELSLAVDPR